MIPERLAYLLKPLVTATLVMFPLFALAQQPTQTRAVRPNLTAEKFDEFGDIAWSDLIARLDNYTVVLQAQPNTRGFIVVYRSRRDLPGLSHSRALLMQDYMIMTRGLPKERIATVDGGVAGCFTQELWIVPPGKTLTPRNDVRIGDFQYSDAAWKFFEYGFGTQEEYAKLGLSLHEDSTAAHLEAYANEARKKPKFIACLVAYAQYNPRPGLSDYGDYEIHPSTTLDPPHTASRQLAKEKQYLIRIYGLPAWKVRTINGGYRKRRAVELWIVPAGEPMPIPTPNSFPQRRRKDQQ